MRATRNHASVHTGVAPERAIHSPGDAAARGTRRKMAPGTGDTEGPWELEPRARDGDSPHGANTVQQPHDHTTYK